LGVLVSGVGESGIQVEDIFRERLWGGASPSPIARSFALSLLKERDEIFLN
jgi:hypothetical protein